MSTAAANEPSAAQALAAQPLGTHLEGVRRIAVLRANGIGDYIVATPALVALRAAYPDAELMLLGLPWHAGFLTGRPGPVDCVVVLPAVPGVGTGDGTPSHRLERFFVWMREQLLDLAIQLHGGGRHSNPFVRRLGARLTAGLRAPDAEPLDRWAHYAYYQHEALRFLEAVALVGAQPDGDTGPVALPGTPRGLSPSLAVTPTIVWSLAASGRCRCGWLRCTPAPEIHAGVGPQTGSPRLATGWQRRATRSP